MSVLFSSFSTSPKAEKVIRLILIVSGVALLAVACNPYRSPYSYGYYNNGYALDYFIQSLGAAVQIILIIIGLALLLAGFAIYKFMIQLIGFVIGGIIGAGLFPLLLNNGEPSTILSLIGFVIGGVLGAWLAIVLTAIMIFIMGAIIATALFVSLCASLFNDIPSGAIILIVAIIGGVVLLYLYKMYIIVMTAIQGAVLFGLGIGADPKLWILFFIVGVVVQYGWLKSTGKVLAPGTVTPQPAAGPQPAAYMPAGDVSAAPVLGAYPPPPATATPVSGIILPSQSPATQTSEETAAGKRFCSNCGAPLNPGAQFCGNCGTKL